MHDAPFLELRLTPRRSGVAAFLGRLAWAPIGTALGLIEVALHFLAVLVAMAAAPLAVIFGVVVVGSFVAAGTFAWQGDMARAAGFALTGVVGLVALGGFVQLLAVLLPPRPQHPWH